MSWILLFLAGITEVGWAVGFKSIGNFVRPGTLIATLASMLSSLYLLSTAMKSIPLSVAYPIWTGIGIVGTFIAGVFFFGESVNPTKIACLCLLIVGIVGLKL